MTATNYTPAMITAMDTVYSDAETDSERKDLVGAFANDFGLNVASIRAKLVRMGIYIKPEAKTKNGSKIARKADLVSEIAHLMNVDEDLIGSLEKATKFSLEKLIENLPSPRIVGVE